MEAWRYSKFNSRLHQSENSEIISTVIMVKSRLKNKCMKNMSEENKINYARQINYCVKRLRKEKKNFFANLDTNNITDNKIFWQTVKPFFSDKTLDSDQIVW